MYPKRSNNKPILITVGVMAAVAAALIAANVIVKKPKKPAETEAQKHSVLIYKSSDGSIEYRKNCSTTWITVTSSSTAFTTIFSEKERRT